MRTLLALLLVAPALVAAPVPKAIKRTAATIDGDWRMESSEINGKMNPPPGRDYNLWKVQGDTMTLVRENDAAGAGAYPCRFTSEQSGDGARTFEYTVDKNKYHRRGVCELDGDTLRVAFSSDAGTPPAEVKSGPNVTVYTFKRVQP